MRKRLNPHTVFAAIFLCISATASSALALPWANETPISNAQSCELKYQGGPVISQAQVVAVYWGEVSSKVKSMTPGLVSAIVASPYMDQLSEYNTPKQKIVRGSFASAVPIAPKSTKKQVRDAEVAQELTAQIDAGKLPAPAYDGTGNTNTLYVVYFAPGFTIYNGDQPTCQGLCGFHGATKYKGKLLPFAVVPDFSSGHCQGPCGSMSEEVALGVTTSHEIAEAVTDPDVNGNNNGWVSPGCQAEIGDICSPGGKSSTAGSGDVNGYTLSYEWSNQQKKCALTNPNIGPQGGCTKNDDCSEPTPSCDTEKQTCVGCLTNAECKDNAPTCDSKSHTCRACAADSDCGGKAASCDGKTGKCIQCKTNADCTASAPVCADSKCTGCASDADCTDVTKPQCEKSAGACVPRGAGSPNDPDGGSIRAEGAGGQASGVAPGSGGCNATSSRAGTRSVIAAVLFGLVAIARGRRRARRGVA